jgi:ABC-type multidrug transport system fused ATPase/permease subunit
VFDEATSGLDSETEAAFLEAIDNLAGKKTVIVIAHRASTLRQADIVHIIENGRIAGSGPVDKFTSLFGVQDATSVPDTK